MNDITQPLVLWRGSHKAGSGRGCAMNVISWENGDKTITDYPACSDRMLAQIVQGVNDSMAQADGSLTAEDSLKVLDLGHRTVGTAYHHLPDEDLKVVYVRLAVYAARKVAHLNPDPRVEAALVVAEASANGPNGSDAAGAAYAAYAAAADAADAARAAGAARAAEAAAWAARTAAYAAAEAAGAARAAAYAAHAAAAEAAAWAGVEAAVRYELATEIIDLFIELTNTQPVKLPVGTNDAITCMMATN